MTNTSISFLRQEEKLRKVDAKKAAQVERLGMGATTSKAGIGHSVMNQMNTIVQVSNYIINYIFCAHKIHLFSIWEYHYNIFPS